MKTNTFPCKATRGCKGQITLNTKPYISRNPSGNMFSQSATGYLNRRLTYYKTCPVCGKVNTVRPADHDK